MNISTLLDEGELSNLQQKFYSYFGTGYDFRIFSKRVFN